MKLILFLAAVVLCMLQSTQAVPCSRVTFDSFKAHYNKVYATQEEENRRFSTFCSNLERYDRLNRGVTKGSAFFGITKFSDLTQEEFRQIYLGYKSSSPKARNLQVNVTKSAPTTFDWRDHNPPILTGVYNQGSCGSCWAFSATENIESQWALAGHTLTELSMQQIVDCDTQDGGCNGGDTTTAYDYVESAGGLESLEDYPYTGRNGRCQFDKSKIVASITGWGYTGRSDESQMVNFLSTGGPISICVDASNWDGYNGGIMKATQCGNSLDHCVLIVGYDLNQGYWIVRNSWGKDWGVEDGFIYLQYGKNTCGLADEPTSSTVKSGAIFF